jgi:hypothetical protein
MAVEKFTISRDDATYEAFPHLCRTRSGRILLVYRESNGHVASEYCRLIVRHSDDAGHTWSERQVITDERRSDGETMDCWNCPKIQQLKDGRILLLCETYDFPPGEWGVEDKARIFFWFSDDDGETFSERVATDVRGICPDQVTETVDGRWLLPTNIRNSDNQVVQAITESLDQGKTWSAPLVIYNDAELDEVSIITLPGGELVAYERQDSGRPLQKMISKDLGKTWNGPFATLNPAAIGMPIAGMTEDGLILITGRYGIRSHWRVDMSEETWAKRIAKRGIVIPKQPDNEANQRFVASIERGPYIEESDTEIVMGMGGSSVHTFAFIEPVESALAHEITDQKGLVLPLDLDTSPFADSGYTGWVEYERGKFLVANYIVDNAPLAQIRGYRFSLDDF